jgi:RNA recognition motif-containing protein
LAYIFYFYYLKRILMTKKLYVGNLSYSTTEDEVRQLFAEIGPVASVSLITDRMTGQLKGFGFVEMENDQDADKAIERLNNTQLGERNLTVNEARPRQDSGGDRRGNDRGGSRGGSSRGGGRRY